MQHLFLLSYQFHSIFVVVIAIESLLVWRSGRKYSVPETICSFWMNVGQIIINQTLIKVYHLALLTWAWDHRWFTISIDSAWGVMLLFMGLEFCYYWHHRAAHRVRWVWATHAVHHSVRYFNLSAAYRLGWTSWLSGNIFFFLPLCWLGFSPLAVIAGLSLNLVYQFWLHTELVPRLGILELWLNTPSNHRVHHASNSQYIDKNYGGVTMIFDRLFGTYEPEREDNPPIYGLTQPISSFNPFVVAFHEWGRLYQDFRKSRNWQQVLQYALYSPDWSGK